jgi:hypothetical protein
MNQENPPKEITKENLPDLIEQSKRIKWKKYFVLYGTATIYSVVGIIIAPILFSLSGQIVIGSYPQIIYPVHLKWVLLSYFFFWE